ncbi:MAG: alpha/beta hydrolase family protein [Phycisphaeraceae bacterium]
MLRLHSLAFWVIVFGVCLAIAPVHVDAMQGPTPPGQVARGPGGTDYRFNGMRVTAFGEGATGYWIIEPRQRVEEALPVVVFVHGFGLTKYTAYRAWITHLVRKGNVVIYPRYHVGGIVDPTTFTRAAAAGASKALAQCDGKRHASIDRNQLTMIGHSLGGTIVANLAARPKHYNLPVPRALMLLQPGDTKSDNGLGAFFPSLTEDHRTIAKGTLMLIVDVEGDYFVSPKAGLRIYDNAASIDATDKRRLLLKTDDHGEPAIIADHMLPMAWTDRQTSQGRVNAYDFAAWRWFDALQASALGDKQQHVLVFGDAALDLGQWSDGVPVCRPMDAPGDRLRP